MTGQDAITMKKIISPFAALEARIRRIEEHVFRCFEDSDSDYYDSTTETTALPPDAGWWQDDHGTWWILVFDVGKTDRGQATGFIPINSINKVPPE